MLRRKVSTDKPNCVMAASHHHLNILPWILLVLTSLVGITGEVYQNGSESRSGLELQPELVTEFEAAGVDVGKNTRTKRNNLGGGSGPGGVEGLLASCQLTNLLLYQLLQQSNSNGQLLAGGGHPGNVAQPFPAAAGLVNNFLFPPRLTTFVTTSTFTTKMTSSTVITIPLLFGNKPSPTTITRTTTFDLTTSEVQTITTTIKESTTVVVTPTRSTIVAPTTPLPYIPAPSFQEIEPEYNNNDSNDISDFQNSRPRPEIRDDKIVPTFKAKVSFMNKKKVAPLAINPSQPLSSVVATRKVLRANPATTENYLEEESDDSERTPAYRYGPEAYGVKSWEPQTPRRSFYREPEVEPTPDYQTYHDEDLSRNYYARRLKRRGDVDEEQEEEATANVEREYLLEPSVRSPGFRSLEFTEEVKCTPLPPLETTITVTKTITKFVNPPVGVASVTIAGREAVRPSSGYGQEQVAKGVDRWQPAAEQGRRRGERRFGVTSAQVDQPEPSRTPFQESRTRGRTNPPQNVQPPLLQPQRLANYQAVTPPEIAQTPFQEPSRTRTRGRGDILNRSRSSPSQAPPSTAPETLGSENYGSGEVGDTQRVRQRKRIRRPESE